jgi:hypothetical protein
VSKQFSAAYCAECEEWKPTSVPAPARNGVHVCLECSQVLFMAEVLEVKLAPWQQDMLRRLSESGTGSEKGVA